MSMPMAELNTSMLSETEQRLLQQLADARADVARVERELAEARDRAAAAQRAVAAYYQGGAAAKAVEPIVEVWLTGIANNLLVESPDFAPGSDERKAIDAIHIRGQGFGNRGKIVAKAGVAIKIAEWLEEKSLEIRRGTPEGRAKGGPSYLRKLRSDGDSVARSAALIRERVREALG